MIDEYALREAFAKIKGEISEIKDDIRLLNEKLNEISNENCTEKVIENVNNKIIRNSNTKPTENNNKKINKVNFEEEIELTDSYY